MCPSRFLRMRPRPLLFPGHRLSVCASRADAVLGPSLAYGTDTSPLPHATLKEYARDGEQTTAGVLVPPRSAQGHHPRGAATGQCRSSRRRAAAWS